MNRPILTLCLALCRTLSRAFPRAFACALLLAQPALAAGEWSGAWKVAWPGGGAYFTLAQDGEAVTGSYGNGEGTIAARSAGKRLEGRLLHNGLSDGFSLVLQPDGAGFSGATTSGDWLSGWRLTAEDGREAAAVPDLSSPRAALRSFLAFCNRARDEEPQMLSGAIAAVDFGDRPADSALDGKLAAVRSLFATIDRATFSLSRVPGEAEGPEASAALPRLDGAPPVSVSFRRGGDGHWRIVMPAAAPDDVRGTARQGPEPGIRDLTNPRDTLRSFLSGMARWTEGGDSDAIATLDLAATPEFLRAPQGRIMAEYLVRIIDRIGFMPLQSVPNSGADKTPFVYFEHPEGSIVIEPVDVGGAIRWQFSAETVEGAAHLFRAVQSLPVAHALPAGTVPASPIFTLRDGVKVLAPGLLGEVAGRIEYWQLLASLMLLILLALLIALLRWPISWLLRRKAVSHYVRNPTAMATAISLALAVPVIAALSSRIGMPAAIRQYTVPAFGSALLSVAAYIAWQAVNAIHTLLERHAERTATRIDNILLSFTSGVAKMAILTGLGFALSVIWSMPATGILAGLGISGLAIAFASKETLANVFGAGILLGDRPFRKGDRIAAGDIAGIVESVGLRSTRIRTDNGSMMVVPNGLLADSAIDNHGSSPAALSSTLLVSSGATPQNISAFVMDLSARLSAEPAFAGGSAAVAVTGLTPAGVEISLSASHAAPAGADQGQTLHTLYLDILRLAQRHGLGLGGGADAAGQHGIAAAPAA